MKIDVSKISKDFLISQEDVCGTPHILVCPTKGKNKWADEELHLRSLLLKPNGEIVSSGFPKFFNYGKDSKSDFLIRKGIADGTAIFIEKMDGSLIIRDIINGKVSLRTRGCHNLGEYEEDVMALINEKYPLLLDPDFGSAIHWSMLFEYVSPKNRVILNYSESELYFLGASILFFGETLPKFYPATTFDRMNERIGVKIPTIYSFNKPLEEILKLINTWKDKEGLVVGVVKEDGSYHLSKLKTEEYIRLHSLRYNLSEARVEQICWALDIKDEKTLRDWLTVAGLDWEVTEFVSSIFSRYMENRKIREEEIQNLIDRIEEEGIPHLETKKEKAIALKDICDDSRLFSLGIHYSTGDEVKFKESKMSYLTQVSHTNLKEWLEEGRLILNNVRPI